MSAASDQASPGRRVGSFPGDVGTRAWSGLTLSTPFAAWELIPAGVLLLVVGAVVYGAHVIHGSFYLDDWANAAYTAFPPHPGYIGAIREYFTMFGFRPLLAVYVPTVHEILGLHQHMHIAWSVFLAVVLSVTVYATLRTLRLERLPAFLIAALVLVFPYSDGSVMWSTASVGHLVTALYLVGLMLAVRALRTDDRKSARRYHVASLIFYFAAVTTYEIVATVALASVVIYVWQSDWRKALRRFLVDVVAIAAALVWTATHTESSAVHSASGGVHHVILILGQGLYVIAETLIPFGHPPHLLVIGLGAAIIAACAAAWFLSLRRTAAGPDTRRWLLMAVAGPLWAYVAWAVFVPSDPYYEPTGLGIGNRTNVIAVIGLVAGVYALVMLVGTVVFSRARRRREITTVVAIAAAVALGVGYVHRISSDDKYWNLATNVQLQVLGALKRQIPQPVQNATIFAYGFPVYTAPGVPAFSASWDLNGAVEVTYHDGALHGYPVYTPAAMVCDPHGMYPNMEGYTAAFAAPYGRAYLLDVGGGRVYRPLNQAECNSALGRGVPRPARG